MNAEEEQRRKNLGFLIGLPLTLTFLVAGTIGAWKGGSGLWLEYSLEQRGIVVTAEVTRSVARQTGGQSQRKRSWRDVSYTFTTENGTWHNTVDIDIHQRPPRAGDKISVHYLPGNPSMNWPTDYGKGWWNWFAAGFGGLVALASGFVVIGMIVTRLRGR